MAMGESAPAEKANGLATYFAVLTSPSAAFDQLKRTPMWGWAALASIALMLVATIVSMPELLKVAHIQQEAAFSQMPADQQAQARQNASMTTTVTSVVLYCIPLIAPWIIWLVSRIVFTIGAAVSGAAARFSLAWVVAVNASAVAWVGAVINAIILALRGPDAIAAAADANALPSLSMLMHGGVKLTAFLNAYNILNIWFYIVAAIGLERTLSARRGGAVATVIIYSLISAGIAAAFAR
jgi:Yip1-like protein